MKHLYKILKYCFIQQILIFNFVSICFGYRRVINKINVITNDNLLIARCRSKCYSNQDKTCDNTCIRDYLENSAYKKYGDCPKKPSNVMDAICINTCDGVDYKCGGTEKCCPHSCGMSCQEPFGLDIITGLPPVPYNVTLTEPRKNYRSAEIKWDMTDKLDNNSPLFYIVESRSHIGQTLATHKMNDWHFHMPQHYYEEKTSKCISYVGSIKLKPGRWYQIRVAAVNEMGTRGYSVYSQEFQLSKKPNAPKSPKNVTLGPLFINKYNTYNRRIFWNISKSDLPVEKYKISWSLYLNEKDQNKNLNKSLFKESATVSEPTRHYDIRGLLPNSMYYLQIQAISIYGKKRLKSDTLSSMMNTTLPDTPIASSKQIMDNLLMHGNSFHKSTKSALKNFSIGSVQIRFLFKNKALVVNMNWNDKVHDRYKLHLCKGNKGCLLKKSMGNFSHDIVLKKNTYDFTNLKFGTQYTLGFKFTYKNSPKYDIIKTFNTPTCESFRRKYPNFTEIKCTNTKGNNIFN